MIVRSIAATLVFCAAVQTLHADVFRWDNGELIPGTEGITPGPNVDLSSLDLEYADLSGVNLTRARLSGANLSNADLSRANLTDATLSFGATLTNVNLSQALVTGTQFDSSLLTKEQLYSTASYMTKTLRGIRLQSRGPGGWDFSGQDLTGARLSGNLRDANFTGAIVTQASLRGSFAEEQLYTTASYQARNLRGIDLSNSVLDGWDFRGQDLTEASFHQAKLADANFAGANLSNASLRATTLTGANFEDSNLSRADLGFAVGFSAAPSTVSRNAINPDEVIDGLDLRPGEYVTIPSRGTRPLRGITVQDTLIVNQGGTLGMEVSCSFGCPESSHLSLSPGINVELQGTLRILGRVREPESFDLFDWPQQMAPGSRFSLVDLPAGAWDLSQLYESGEITLTSVYRLDGDFNVDDQLDATDIDRLTLAAQIGRDASYDVNGDERVDHLDRVTWVHGLKRTFFGDANLDGEFNSGDLVDVFTAGEYEDGIPENSGWAEGDWNGNSDFDSGDFVTAFTDGGYEQGPRPALAAVPEPNGIGMMMTALALTAVSSSRRRGRGF